MHFRTFRHFRLNFDTHIKNLIIFTYYLPEIAEFPQGNSYLLNIKCKYSLNINPVYKRPKHSSTVFINMISNKQHIVQQYIQQVQIV